MKKIFLTLSVVLLFAGVVNAQDYKTGIGARLGWDVGLTVKHFLNEKSAIEGILAYPYKWGGPSITGLYEIHNNIGGIERLRWFIGGGAHVGFYGSGYTGGAATAIGLDGILGLEYSFSDIPINLSLDWKPQFDIVPATFFGYQGVALSIRYILK